MFRLIEGLVAVNVVTVGAVASTTTVAGEPNAADTLPEASFAHGYNIWVPSEVTRYVAGAVEDQPPSLADGGVGDVVIL